MSGKFGVEAGAMMQWAGAAGRASSSCWTSSNATNSGGEFGLGPLLKVLRRAIHALGDYGHVSVQAVRGPLTICVDEDTPVARATPLGVGQFGVSFHTHTSRWEPMPVVADLTHLAHDLVGLLAYLQRWDFPDRNSGSDH